MPVQPSTQGGPRWDVELFDPGTRVIDVIREIRTATGRGLAEAKECIDRVPCVVGTGLEAQAAQAYCEALAAAGARAWMKPTPAIEAYASAAPGPHFRVSLLETGANKILVIKTLRELLDVGLKQAKDLSESAPVPLHRGLDAERAQSWARKLEAAGAKVRVEPSG